MEKIKICFLCKKSKNVSEKLFKYELAKKSVDKFISVQGIGRIRKKLYLLEYLILNENQRVISKSLNFIKHRKHSSKDLQSSVETLLNSDQLRKCAITEKLIELYNEQIQE